MKQINVAEKIKEYETQIQADYARWQRYYNYGGDDPFWPDGVNLNLLRNHILYSKQKIMELCRENALPEIEFSVPTPPEMEDSYMARAEQIRENAKKSLMIYELNEDYCFLKDLTGKIREDVAKKIGFEGVLGYVESLKQAIERDDLVTMRRHERAGRYLNSFKECAAKLRNEEKWMRPQPGIF